MVPKTPVIHSLIIFPTPPPYEKPPVPEKIKCNETDNTSNPIVTYFKFLQIENIFRLKSILTPTTKKKVQMRKEAIPNAVLIKKFEAMAPNLPNRFETWILLSKSIAK